MSIKTERIASNLHREISDIIANEIRDEDIKFVTITHVRLAPDLSYAKIFFTTLLTEKKDKILKDLNGAKGFVKKQLCDRKIKIRRMPELEFVYDESIEYGSKIEDIIKNLPK